MCSEHIRAQLPNAIELKTAHSPNATLSPCSECNLKWLSQQFHSFLIRYDWWLLPNFSWQLKYVRHTHWQRIYACQGIRERTSAKKKQFSLANGVDRNCTRPFSHCASEYRQLYVDTHSHAAATATERKFLFKSHPIFCVGSSCGYVSSFGSSAACCRFQNSCSLRGRKSNRCFD